MHLDEACFELFFFGMCSDIWSCIWSWVVETMAIWSTNSAIGALHRRRPDVSTSSLMTHSESGFSGNRDLIRSSEVYPPGFGLAVANMLQAMIGHS